MTPWCQDANPKSWCFDVFSFSYARRRGCKKRQDHWDINHDIFIYNIKLQYIILYNHIIIIYIYIIIHSYYSIYYIPCWFSMWKTTPSNHHGVLTLFWQCQDSSANAYTDVLLRLRSFGFVVRDTALLKVTGPHREDYRIALDTDPGVSWDRISPWHSWTQDEIANTSRLLVLMQPPGPLSLVPRLE